jgi:N-acetyl-gamma-glutamyl-phosphate reductase
MNVSIVGASGYSGAELLKILLRHRDVNVKKVFANNNAGKRVDEVYGVFRSQTNLVYEKYSPDQISDSDVVFVALPSGDAMHVVPEILKANKRVIDLGGDFRLKDPSSYQKFYKHEHVSKEFLAESVYGLPEWNGEKIRKAQLVANPGCYSTSAILPLIPLVKENIIEEKGIVISSLSGVSGAGRSALIELSFSEVNESVRAYKVGVHQHTPEIESAISDASGRDVTVTFVPHLIPITRGINTTVYARLQRTATQGEIAAIYQKYYSKAPFVRVDGAAIPEIKNVNYTNFCDIGFRIDESNKTIVLISVIDNLVKGAAGQAVQNMNIMFGFNETEGLL